MERTQGNEHRKRIKTIEDVARSRRGRSLYTRVARLHENALPKQQIRRLAQTYNTQYELATKLLEVAQLLPPARRELFMVVGQYLDNALRVLADKMMHARSEKVQVDAAYRILRTVEAITANAVQTNVLINIDNTELTQKVEEYKRMLVEYIKKNTEDKGEDIGSSEEGSTHNGVYAKTGTQESQIVQEEEGVQQEKNEDSGIDVAHEEIDCGEDEEDGEG